MVVSFTTCIMILASDADELAVTLLAALHSAVYARYFVCGFEIVLEEVAEGQFGEVGGCVEAGAGEVAGVENGVLDGRQLGSRAGIGDDLEASRYPLALAL